MIMSVTPRRHKVIGEILRAVPRTPVLTSEFGRRSSRALARTRTIAARSQCDGDLAIPAHVLMEQSISYTPSCPASHPRPPTEERHAYTYRIASPIAALLSKASMPATSSDDLSSRERDSRSNPCQNPRVPALAPLAAD